MTINFLCSDDTTQMLLFVRDILNIALNLYLYFQLQLYWSFLYILCYSIKRNIRLFMSDGILVWKWALIVKLNIGKAMLVYVPTCICPAWAQKSHCGNKVYYTCIVYKSQDHKTKYCIDVVLRNQYLHLLLIQLFPRKGFLSLVKSLLS